MTDEQGKPSDSKGGNKSTQRLEFEIPAGATKEELADLITERILAMRATLHGQKQLIKPGAILNARPRNQ